MANPYVDTTLIECNRLQSTQQEQVETSESNAIADQAIYVYYSSRVFVAILGSVRIDAMTVPSAESISRVASPIGPRTD